MRVSRVPSANASTRWRPATAACTNRSSARAYGSIEPLTSSSSTSRRGRSPGSRQYAADRLAAGAQRGAHGAAQVGAAARSRRGGSRSERRGGPARRRSAISCWAWRQLGVGVGGEVLVAQHLGGG